MSFLFGVVVGYAVCHFFGAFLAELLAKLLKAKSADKDKPDA